MADAADLRLITFRVGRETFVLDIMEVRQIVPYSGSTSVPTAPRFIEGIIVLRNDVIPIIDLRERLYPRLTGQAAEPLILITETSAGVIGLKVDEVRRIITVSPESFLPPPPLVRGVRGELLIGVVPHKDEIYLLIDVENVLSADEKEELREAALEEETPNTEQGTRNEEHGTTKTEGGTSREKRTRRKKVGPTTR